MTGKSTKITTVQQVKQDLFRTQFAEHSNYSDLARATQVKRDALRGDFEDWGWEIHTVLVEKGVPTAISARPLGSHPADPATPESPPPAAPTPPAPTKPLTAREKLDAETQQILKNHRPPPPRR